MALSEFSIIERFFSSRQPINPSTRLGIGDDCALLTVPDGNELAVTTDTMVENVHFLPDTNPEFLGHKILAVNLSDLAGMGAKPIAVTLALTIPGVDEKWLREFAKGFFRLSDQYSVDLIGGDTTSGPLTLTVQAMGIVPTGKALRRSTAKAGDLIYVTGKLGDAGLGLKIEQGYPCSNSSVVLERFHRPEPRVAAGLLIRQYANACIDISDGLTSDLGQLLDKSNAGAAISWERLPISSEVLAYIEATSDWEMPLCAGDDYELCFTVSPEKQASLEVSLEESGIEFSRIGMITSKPGLTLERSGQVRELTIKGFEHFT